MLNVSGLSSIGYFGSVFESYSWASAAVAVKWLWAAGACFSGSSLVGVLSPSLDFSDLFFLSLVEEACGGFDLLFASEVPLLCGVAREETFEVGVAGCFFSSLSPFPGWSWPSCLLFCETAAAALCRSRSRCCSSLKGLTPTL